MLFLRILSPFYFVVSVKLVADGILRGCGLMVRFMIATFTDLILRVLLAFVLSGTALGATGIWCAWPIGWCVATVVSICCYRTGPWNQGVETVELEAKAKQEEPIAAAEAEEEADIVI